MIFPNNLHMILMNIYNSKKGDLRVEKVTCLQLNNIWSYLPPHFTVQVYYDIKDNPIGIVCDWFLYTTEYLIT